MPPVGFEPTISAGVRPQTYALDRAATGTGAHKQCTEQRNETEQNIHNNKKTNTTIKMHNLQN